MILNPNYVEPEIVSKLRRAQERLMIASARRQADAEEHVMAVVGHIPSLKSRRSAQIP
jgi:hypothetical protein